MKFQAEQQKDPVRSRTKIRLMDGKQCVSSLVVYDLQMRVGESMVRIGGIGDVGTPPEHRKKGYAAKCLDYANGWMLKNDYDMALLFGIKDFYWRFGYATCMCNYDVTMRTVDAEAARRKFKSRLMKAGDVAAVTALSQEANTYRTGSIDRSAYGASPIQPGKGIDAPIVVVDARGKFAGYACFFSNRDVLQVQEIHALSMAALESLLPAIAEIAVKLRMHEIHFRIPPDLPVADLIARLGGTMTTTWPHESETMARIINLRTTMEKVAPTLDRRLEEAGMLHEIRPINIETEIGSCSLVPDGGVVEVAKIVRQGARIKLPQRRLAQLLMGYSTPEVLRLEKGASIPASLDPILNILFPRQIGFCWRRDMF
ncbi:MAG TPA: GNAT family N-acetyltransferase [Candidatus Brocadiia bacterium]|nr:GNAT family N-acetyltransferase [Candidatus Brocadiia bacterium]